MVVESQPKQDALACMDITEADLKNAIKQISNLNVLLAGDGNSLYQDHSKDPGLEITGWTWNANFADLDNDGYIDLYAAYGRVPSNKRESNFILPQQG